MTELSCCTKMKTLVKLCQERKAHREVRKVAREKILRSKEDELEIKRVEMLKKSEEANRSVLDSYECIFSVIVFKAYRLFNENLFFIC